MLVSSRWHQPSETDDRTDPNRDPDNENLHRTRRRHGPTTQAGQELVHKTGRHGGKIAAGIALGLLGAAAIAHQSYRCYRDDEESHHERRCRRMNLCDDGHGRSCRKFDRRC